MPELLYTSSAEGTGILAATTRFAVTTQIRTLWR
jgi:hypothetical protein